MRKILTINKNIPYYLAAAAIFLLLKFVYTITDTADLIFLLKPTNYIVSLAMDSPYAFTKSGYFHPDLNIIIDKSCSGFNFWLICFMMLLLPTIAYVHSLTKKILAFPVIFITAFLLTIFVNASRILMAIQIGRSGILSDRSWLHEAEGAFVYLSFLILIYFAFDYCLNRLKNRHEKPA